LTVSIGTGPGISSAVVDGYARSIASELTRDERVLLLVWLWVVKPGRRPGDTIARLVKKGLFRPTRAKSGSTMNNLTPFGRIVQLQLLALLGCTSTHPIGLCIELENLA
jgi:hypothetical protein